MGKTCQNCGTVIHQGPYCEFCGQRNIHERLEFSVLVDDLREQIFELHLPWLFTLKELTLRPGKVCADYLAGKRVRYVNPLKYLVYLTAIIAVVTSFLPLRYRLSGALLSDDRLQSYNFLARLVYNNPSLVYLFVSLLMPFVIRVMFPRTHYNKTELNVVTMFLMGHLILLFTVAGIATQLLIDLATNFMGDWGFFVVVPFMVLVMIMMPVSYTALVIRKLFGLSLINTVLRSMALALLGATMFSLTRYIIFSYS